MKAVAIVNPSSGRSNARKLMQRIESGAAARSLDLSVVLWERPEDIDELVARALDEGCDTIVAAGGDGTIHKIGCRLLGTDTRLGIIPAGTGNALAHHLGIPHSVEACLDLLKQNHALRIDTGRVNGRPFLAFFGFGLDAAIIQRYARVRKRNFFTYAWYSVGHYLRYQRYGCRIEWADGSHDWKPDFLSVMNIGEFGMRAKMARGASVCDGQLDLFAVWVPGWWYVPVLAWNMFYGELKESDRYRRLRAASLRIVREQEGACQLDGEPVEMSAELHIEVLPESLWVVVPEGAVV